MTKSSDTPPDLGALLMSLVDILDEAGDLAIRTLPPDARAAAQQTETLRALTADAAAIAAATAALARRR